MIQDVFYELRFIINEVRNITSILQSNVICRMDSVIPSSPRKWHSGCTRNVFQRKKKYSSLSNQQKYKHYRNSTSLKFVSVEETTSPNSNNVNKETMNFGCLRILSFVEAAMNIFFNCLIVKIYYREPQISPSFVTSRENTL